MKKLPDTTVDVDYPRSTYVVTKHSPRAGLPSVCMFWKMPSYNTNKKEMIAMSIAAGIMVKVSSSFHKALIKDKQVATAISVFNNTTYNTNEGCPPNLLCIEATATQQCDADNLLKNLNIDINNIIEKGFSEEELQSFKDNFKILNYFMEDNALKVFGFFINLGLNYSYQDFLEHSKIIEEMDLTFLNNTFKKYMSRNSDAIGKIIPMHQNNNAKSE